MERFYTRAEAAVALRISVSTLDMAISRALLRARRKGKRVFVAESELERFSAKDVPAIWPAKRNGAGARRQSNSIASVHEKTNATSELASPVHP